jgi:hypothetical protein
MRSSDCISRGWVSPFTRAEAVAQSLRILISRNWRLCAVVWNVFVHECTDSLLQCVAVQAQAMPERDRNNVDRNKNVLRSVLKQTNLAGLGRHSLVKLLRFAEQGERHLCVPQSVVAMIERPLSGEHCKMETCGEYT